MSARKAKAAREQTFTLEIHHEDGSYWAEVSELPGCFAAGDTLDELSLSAVESITLYLMEDSRPLSMSPTRRRHKSPPMPRAHADVRSAQIALMA